MDKSCEYELKPPATYKEMIGILKSRGLTVENESRAIDILKRINYYRLTGYLLPYKINEEEYIHGTTFEQVVDLYDFDMRLRSLLLDIFEYVEISMRSKISYHLAHKYGSECYENPSNFSFRKITDHHNFVTKISEELDRSKELFVNHYKTKYGNRYPIWVAVEVLSFSSLSILYTNLKPEDKRIISREFGLKTARLLDSWLHSMCVLRNRCAHFSRIYNTKLTQQISLTFNAQELKIEPNSLYSIIFTLKYPVKEYSVLNPWIIELSSLIDHYRDVCDLSRMGFIEDWEKHLRSIPTDIHPDKSGIQ
ncbi:Abi family protein [Paenibacillus sp. GCM10027626]|uniref:Abi family protein n=1 Tax=Paenibacillus sp. GCM10027626 TaxID=3273411 RepID=UPI00362B0949